MHPYPSWLHAYHLPSYCQALRLFPAASSDKISLPPAFIFGMDNDTTVCGLYETAVCVACWLPLSCPAFPLSAGAFAVPLSSPALPLSELSVLAASCLVPALLLFWLLLESAVFSSDLCCSLESAFLLSSWLTAPVTISVAASSCMLTVCLIQSSLYPPSS